MRARTRSGNAGGHAGATIAACRSAWPGTCRRTTCVSIDHAVAARRSQRMYGSPSRSAMVGEGSCAEACGRQCRRVILLKRNICARCRGRSRVPDERRGLQPPPTASQHHVASLTMMSKARLSPRTSERPTVGRPRPWADRLACLRAGSLTLSRSPHRPGRKSSEDLPGDQLAARNCRRPTTRCDRDVRELGSP